MEGPWPEILYKGAFESRKEPIGSPKKDLLKVAKSSCGCYSRQIRVSAVKLEAIGPAEKKVEGTAFGLYGIHSSATRLMREETDLPAYTYASEGGKESN